MAQEKGGQDEAIGWIIIGGMFVVFLLPALFFALVFFAFGKVLNLKWWHMALPAAAIPLVLAVTHDAGPMAVSYFKTVKSVFILGGNRFAGINWWHVILFSVLGGLAGAGGLTILAEKSGAKKKIARAGPLSWGENWGEKRLLKRLSKKEHPPNGVLIGLQDTRRPTVIADEELNQHCLIVGTTGSGKTTTLMNFAESAISRNIPLVMVDGKGARDLAERVKYLADRYDRSFYLFSMHGESWHYNPLARGKITELKDKLVDLTEWTEEHYKKMAERYLQLVFRCFEQSGTKLDLIQTAEYLDLDDLAVLARGIGDEEERSRILNALDAFSVPEIKGLAARIAVMTESEIGHLFKDVPGRTIDLARAIEENAVVVFLLDSLSFPEYSRLLGRLIVTDLKGVAARQSGKKTVYTIFDEFNVFASSAVVDLIAKTRSFGFCTLIGTQSPSDLERAGGPAMLEQIVENCNTYIIQRQNSAVNAEKLSSVIGTTDSREVTHQVQGIFFKMHTGLGSVRETKEFIIHPDVIKRLGTGEAILVRKARGFRVEKIMVRKLQPG